VFAFSAQKLSPAPYDFRTVFGPSCADVTVSAMDVALQSSDRRPVWKSDVLKQFYLQSTIGFVFISYRVFD
jgi:hypothetical protein